MKNSLKKRNPTVDPKTRLPWPLVEKAYEAVGAASVCWENHEPNGTFQSEQADVVAHNLCHDIADIMELKGTKFGPVKHQGRKQFTYEAGSSEARKAFLEFLVWWMDRPIYVRGALLVCALALLASIGLLAWLIVFIGSWWSLLCVGILALIAVSVFILKVSL